MKDNFTHSNKQEKQQNLDKITKELTLYTFSKVIEFLNSISEEDYQLWFSDQGKPLIFSNQLAEHILEFMKSLSEEEINYIVNGEAKITIYKSKS